MPSLRKKLQQFVQGANQPVSRLHSLMPMIVRSLILSLLLLVISRTSGQDTFSIVAVDTITGEIGSAGATCLDNNDIIGGAAIISDLLPGRGAIHTQSFYLQANRTNARNRMLAGDSPQQIIDWLVQNDAQGDSTVRQYGIVDVDSLGNPRAASFTGSNCLDWKGHRVGIDYAIQGNILLGSQILDNMEMLFVNTPGSLAEKLMAAMQGANTPGADSRCLNEGVSSRSAFLFVARPNDPYGSNYLNLLVGETPFGQEPIDSLQEIFNAWTPPNCSFSIPSTAIVVESDTSITGNDLVIWVCTDDSVHIDGSNNTILLENGSSCTTSSGNQNNSIYLKRDATVNAAGALLSEIYYQPGSVLENTGIASTFSSCDTVIFDYSDAPASNCLTPPLSVDPISPDWSVSIIQNEGELHILLPGLPSVNLSLWDMHGKQIWGSEELRSHLDLSFIHNSFCLRLVFVESNRWETPTDQEVSIVVMVIRYFRFLMFHQPQVFLNPVIHG